MSPMLSKTRPATALKTAMSVTLAALALSASTTSPAHAQDAVQWRVEDGGNGHWYAHPVNPLTWVDARSAAESVGGYLASVTSDQEHEYLLSLVPYSAWLGGNDIEAEGEWVWTNGDLWRYERWDSNKPNNNGSGEDALYMTGTSHPTSTGLWYDGATGESQRYVIEWSADCNNDGIVDYGQILDGTFADDDGNGVPDPCDQPGGFDGILDVPAEYATIQAAIDAAPDGGVVRIAPGRYFENLVVSSRSISLIGSGSHQTVLDGQSLLSVIRVTDAESVQIRRLQITNGKRIGDQILGGGISAERVARLTIEDCLIAGNQSDYQGGGIASMDVAMTTVRRTGFVSNLAGLSGGCCGASGGAAVIRGLGGGGPCLGSSSALFENCYFVQNTAETNNGLPSFGGAIQFAAASKGTLEIRDSLFSQNHAESGTAIRISTGCAASTGSIVIDHSIIYGAPTSTPAIEGHDLDCLIRDSILCTEDGYPPISIPFQDAGGNSIGGICQIDDCDMNGIADIEQIIDGTVSDCDGNLIPDECDLNDIESFTEPRTPASVADFIEFDVSSMSDAADAVALEVSAIGDLATISEFMFVFLDDVQIGLAFVATGSACSPVTDTLSIPAADWNAAAADGTRYIRISGVNIAPDACAEPSTSIRVVVPQPITDCDGNGAWDACDIASGDAADLDSNGVPDSCDPDCDGDGEPDGYEIATGQDLDCNGNLVPDACDLADGGGSSDVDSDGVPDECQPDCDGDGLPDTWELAEGLAMDCNANGHPDNCDIADGTSNDIDSNGTPDECKDDCNGNGIPDYWEILKGQVEDCDGNGIPDACDIAAGNLADCDLDGRWDECAIDDGSVTDCNGNRVPDTCDITGGTDEDDNGNGTPDACEIALGDLNLDGCIDAGDLGLLIALWGISNPPFGDLNGDGTISAADLGLLIGNWTPGCP